MGHRWSAIWTVGLVIGAAWLVGAGPAAAVGLDGWDRMLATYVNAEGHFDYAGLDQSVADREALSQIVEQVATAELDGESRRQRLAFWINAYNVLVVHAVMERYPIASVMDVDGFFDELQFTAAGARMTLNDVENGKIRAVFKEPRIHFAVNCASVGCPPLRAEAYVRDRLDAQLEEQTREYLRGSVRIDRDRDRFEVTKIFEWFAEDFKPAGGVRSFVAGYLPEHEARFVRDQTNALSYLEWDWDLNEAGE